MREVHVLRAWLVHHHLLVDGDRVTLIDGGFVGGVERIARRLRTLGLEWRHVTHLLLTHGHLDHTRNAGRIRSLSGCRVLAPRADADHIAGRHPYRGWSRLCGLAETVGRRVLRYETPVVDQWIEPGDVLDVWGGLHVVGLPGHTLGHCGFYSPSERLLFCGDLFANHWGLVKLPPPWFNVDAREARASLHRALALDLVGVHPNHCRPGTAAGHLEDLRRLARWHPVADFEPPPGIPR